MSKFLSQVNSSWAPEELDVPGSLEGFLQLLFRFITHRKLQIQTVDVLLDGEVVVVLVLELMSIHHETILGYKWLREAGPDDDAAGPTESDEGDHPFAGMHRSRLPFIPQHLAIGEGFMNGPEVVALLV